MRATLCVPSFTADAVEYADYLELLALSMDDRSASIYDLGRVLVQDGGLEELPEDEPDSDSDPVEYPSGQGGERVQELMRTATMEVERRLEVCGQYYPFNLDKRGVLEACEMADLSVYVFLLLLTVRPSGIIRTEERKLFERLSTEVAAAYLGGGEHVIGECFGFPRDASSGFVAALQNLCEIIGEGSVKHGAESIRHQKDGGVDLVAVKRFPDQNRGQLTIFAQCATGGRWQDKLGELQPETFMKMWMEEHLAVDPIKALFVPVTIQESDWRLVAMKAGIPFDRTRIAYHAAELPAALMEELRETNVRSLAVLRSD